MASKSGNAMMAKVLCLFGRHLNENDYNTLLQKHSVAEITEYLRENTVFASELTEVKQELVHRAQLEASINRFVWNTYLRLSKYAYSDKTILKIYVEKNEIKQILLAIRLLNAGEMGRFIVSLPTYLAKHMSVDLFKIAKAADYDGLLSAVERTPYYRILGRFRPAGGDAKIDITACETALLTNYYTNALEYIEKKYDGDTKQDLKAIIHYEIDLHNVSVIYRLKRYFSSTSKVMAANLIGVRARLSRHTYDLLLGADDYKEVLRIFGSHSMAMRRISDPDCSAEQMFIMLQRIMHSFSKKGLRFSTKPIVVLFAYTALLEIEISNLIHIIEGARYGVAPDQVRPLLVL